MAKQSPKQQKTVKRVMREFEQGELKTSAGSKVRDRKQAIAIGLSEAGASRDKTPAQNRRARAASEQQTRGRNARAEPTRADLYAEAKRRGLTGCSRMSKAELEKTLSRGR